MPRPQSCTAKPVRGSKRKRRSPARTSPSHGSAACFELHWKRESLHGTTTFRLSWPRRPPHREIGGDLGCRRPRAPAEANREIVAVDAVLVVDAAAPERDARFDDCSGSAKRPGNPYDAPAQCAPSSNAVSVNAQNDA